jgi:ethanolamine ammonia-lyase small subunit
MMSANRKDRDEALAFARKMVEKLREQILESSGIQSVASDGISVTYATGRGSGILSQLQYWEKQVILLGGDNAPQQTIDLSKGL